MKKMVIIAALLMAAVGLKAQDCEALMLPYFGNDAVRMANYKAEAPHKFEWRCVYAQSAFYESDSIPAGADVFQITEVSDKFTGKHLPVNYQVDLTVLSYYAYNFIDFQLRYPHGDKTICFATPRSAHPYLVLRSIDDMHRLTNQIIDSKISNR
jgi:hypothetical protein